MNLNETNVISSNRSSRFCFGDVFTRNSRGVVARQEHKVPIKWADICIRVPEEGPDLFCDIPFFI